MQKCNTVSQRTFTNLTALDAKSPLTTLINKLSVKWQPLRPQDHSQNSSRTQTPTSPHDGMLHPTTHFPFCKNPNPPTHNPSLGINSSFLTQIILTREIPTNVKHPIQTSLSEHKVAGSRSRSCTSRKEGTDSPPSPSSIAFQEHHSYRKVVKFRANS